LTRQRYVERCRGWFGNKPGEVAAYDGAWKALEESALDPGRSADLIAMISKEISNA
jgi:hypothetical protein